MTTARSDLLNDAEQLVTGDRNAQYGDPRQDFMRTAKLWTAYLDGKSEIEPHDVAAMMALLKCSRIRWSPEKRDSWVDIAGYAACGWECAEPEKKPEAPSTWVDISMGTRPSQTLSYNDFIGKLKGA